MTKLVWAVIIAAQVLSSESFEVASVRTNRSSDAAIRIDMPGGDRFTATNVPLRQLILFAYGVQDTRLIGGPDWIRSERFDVDARAGRILPPWTPAGPPREVLQMLKALLAARFGLVVHQETRDLPVYALVVARNGELGPAIRPSTLGCGNPSKPAGPVAPAGPSEITCGMRIGPGQMVIGGTPMSQVATILPSFVQRVVIDRTGLEGGYDFRLSWTPEGLRRGAPPPGPPSPEGFGGTSAPLLPPADPDGATIFTALQEQLGLRLDPQQAPLDVFVIDRIDRPTPD
jgi:uncharacterized protein (TIGR03435 family)